MKLKEKPKSVILSFFVLTFLMYGCSQAGLKVDPMIAADSIFMSVPPQPDEEKWEFVKELQSPMWGKHVWDRKIPDIPYADLSGGISLKKTFPDPDGRLETAYADLKNFLKAADISSEEGKFLIETVPDDTLLGETFILEVKPDRCVIKAGDVEGIRRGIFQLEDEMLKFRGPFLATGAIRKEPFIKRRISRCFFGPIKRFPKMRDELMDDINYYPDEYLNRLAHEGVNGLWLTIEFRDLVTTDFTPYGDKNREKRIDKLRKTVDQCLRYGIRTYIFTIEPRAWGNQPPTYADQDVPDKYPELGGVKRGNVTYFCPSGDAGRKYLYQAVNGIFKQVPGLGGLINISYGERGTTCLSTLNSTTEYNHDIDCPRCRNKEPWEIHHASLSAMEKGMHDAAPDAELISWLYIPHPQRYVSGDPNELASWVYDLPAHTPEGVILQYNFESGVSRTEFGKLLVGGDYWISNPGPSERFAKVADIARNNNSHVSAKIQTGNSHEVATVPFVPVPSLLYRKFSAMKDLGVSHTMLCWYFGNYPGLMNKAAGLLSTAPFPGEEEFLENLASQYWKKEDVSMVVNAWKLFSKGYSNYPLTNLFQYYGPIHDGPVWPLFLKPVDEPLSPSWQIGSSTTLQPWPPSGDRVGECTGPVLNLQETAELCRRMSVSWDEGLNIFRALEPKYRDEPERLKDIGVAKALGIQIRSGYNILTFYLMREKLFRMEGKQRHDILEKMTDIINEEILLDEELLILCDNDSRLGFHSEAEGYKYYPEKIRWRIKQLQQVLQYDVPEIKKMIRRNESLFPEYTGMQPAGLVATSYSVVGTAIAIPENDSIKWQSCMNEEKESEAEWISVYDQGNLYLIFRLKELVGKQLNLVRVKLEPQRLVPVSIFEFIPGKDGNEDPTHIPGYPLIYRGGILRRTIEGENYPVIRIPVKIAGLDLSGRHPLRLNVQIQTGKGGASSWIKENPSTSRLILGTENPADLGWLILK